MDSAPGMKKFHFFPAVSSERDNGGAPPAGFQGRIRKVLNERRSCQDGSNHLALHADPAPVNDAQGLETEAARLFQILLDNRPDIARGNGVKVEYIGDGDADRLFVLFHCC